MGKKKITVTKVGDNDGEEILTEVNENDIEKGMKKDKGKKGKKGKRKDDDEDLDDLMAELESEYTGVPVKPKEKEESIVIADSASNIDEKLDVNNIQLNGGEEMDSEGDKGAKKGKDKKSKKGKRKNDDDHDDLMAELESEYLGVPVKPKEAKESDDQVVDAVSKNLGNLKIDTKENDEGMDKGGKKDKSKKGKKNKRKEDDEDLDDLMAELESEYTGMPIKPKEKNEATVYPDDVKKDERNGENDESVQQTLDSKDDKKGKQKDKAKKEAKDSMKKDEAKKKGDGKAEAKSKAAKKEEEKRKKKLEEERAKEEEEASKSKKSKPNKKMLEAMKEALAKKKEEEERLEKEEEERIRIEEERIEQLIEAKRLEEEKREKKRQKEKDRMKRMKEEGKILTSKQKLEQKRAQAMLQHLKAQGIAVPGAEGDATTPVRTEKKRSKKKKQEAEPPPEEVQVVEKAEELVVEAATEEVLGDEDDVADAWDADSDEEVTEEPSSESMADAKDSKSETGDATDEDEDSDESNDEKERVEYNARDRALDRIAHRKVENEKNKNPDILRAPVVCVLGHVDHGKTKILDKLRKTNVQDGEVGGITQQIGATNVPGDAIKAQTRMVKEFSMDDLSFPGLLIIDTPGHESFSNLRTRGSSLCDIAILVVDITQGLEPQTIESINLLRNRKTPFVVALNKVDRVFEWESHPNEDIKELNKYQTTACKNDFDRRKTEIVQALNVQGLNAALLWENPDPRSYVSLIPTSAISGDGMGNLMSLICSMCQTRLGQRLIYTEELQCTVLEVKTIQGHGVTIDVILVNGKLKEGDTIVIAGTEGPIITNIRSLLLPKPCKEIRVKGQYDEFKEVRGAQGVKIAAKELEKAIAGLNLKVAHHEDEIEVLKEEVDKDFRSAMRAMKVKDRGVYVQASTLGALEALLEFFKANSVPYSGIRVGPVVKRDVMKAAAMLEHEPMYAVILAFDVKVERDAQDLADREGVKIFSEETIYHLGDRYVDYIKDFKRRKQEEVKHIAIFPCRLKIIPTAIFNKRDPIVLGVTVDAGVLRNGTALCVPSKEFVDIGIVTSLEFDHKPVEIAKKGVDVCIKIEPVPGHTPKLFGRHFEEGDLLVSKISRESINACKDHFRDDLTKNDWKLMAELKKEFSIL